MGTIPAPNIADEAGQIATAPQNALAEFARVAQLKQQTALGQQQTQAAQLENQQKQQQITDQKATTAAFLNWDHKDPDELATAVVKGGGSAAAAQAVQQHFLGLRQTAATIAKDDADTGSKNLATQIEKHNQDLGQLAALDDVPDEQLSQHLSDAGQKLAASKDPAEQQSGQHIMTLAQLPPALARQQLKVIEHGLMGEKEQFAQAQETQKTNTAQQEANAKDWKDFPSLGVSLNTKNGEQKSVNGGPVMAPAMMESKYLAIDQKKRLGQPLSPEDAAFHQSYEHMKELVPVANFNMQNAGATGTAGQPSAIAQALAKGDMQWGEAVSPRTPIAVKQALLKEVQGLKPDFRTGDAALEQATRKDFISGPDAQKLQAFNTAITHMGIFKDAADALDNSDIRGLNKVGNTLGMQFGSDKSTNFSIAKQAFIGEVTRAFDGAGVTMHDREEVEKQISTAGSPAQLKGAAVTAEKLLRGKRDVLKQQYDAGKNAQANFGDANSTPQQPAAGNDFFSKFGGKARPQ